jgi:hypothetical protein
MSGFLDIARAAVHDHGAQQKPTELAAFLAAVADVDPGVVWEIGTATGGTLWAVQEVLADASYVSIDLPDGPYGGDQCVPEGELRRLLGVDRLTTIRGDSRTVDLPDGPRPNLLIIDGDHSEQGVVADWLRYGALVKSGLIALHDIVPHPPYTGVEVVRVWQEIVTDEPFTVEIVDWRPNWQGYQWGGWGLVYR